MSMSDVVLSPEATVPPRRARPTLHYRLLFFILVVAACFPIAYWAPVPQEIEPPYPPLVNLRQLYLVPLGSFPIDWVEDMAGYAEDRFDAPHRVLPPVAIPESAVDRARRQVIADELATTMQAAYPSVANNSLAVLIGFTEHDMYARFPDYPFVMEYQQRKRAGVVSTARLDPTGLGQPTNEDRLGVRLEKLTFRQVAQLGYHLPRNSDPHSILYERVFLVRDLDNLRQDFRSADPRVAAYGRRTITQSTGDGFSPQATPPR
jgi:hypothetical protein